MPNLGNKQTRTIAMLSGVALLVGGIAACGKTETAQSLILGAKQYQQKGDTKAAIIQLKNALQKSPDDVEARYLLGTIYNETGDPKSAEKELRRALGLGMSPTKVMPDLGKALLLQGEFQKALDETSHASGVTNTAEILTLRGNAFLALGKHQEAKESFEQALKDKTDFLDALLGLARYSVSEKDIEAATRFSERAVTQYPKDTNAWLFKGDLLRAQGKPDLALAAYDQVLKLKPDDSSAHINKAFLELDTGKFDAARADIEAARKTTTNKLIVLYAQALVDFRQGKSAAALESLQQILRAAPQHMPSVLLAGAVQYSLGATQQAELYLKQYLEKDPGNIYARKLLAASLLKSHQTQRAIDVLSPVLQNKQQDAQLLALAGESYMQAKDFTKATEYFEKASALDPKSAKAHVALGLSKLAQGENARAVAELEKAAGLDSKSSQADILLIMTHLRNKEYDKAFTVVNALEKAQPENPLAYHLKGAVYLGKNDKASARASFEKALSIQPAFFPAVESLARLDLQEKNPDAAKKRFESILEKDKKNIQAMTALAGLARFQGKDKEATAWLERSSKENPDQLQPAMILAAHYLRIGEKQKALILAQKLQGANPSKPEVLDLLAQTHFANGNKQAALDAWNKVAVLAPESAAAQYRIASAHMAMQNQPAASDALKKALSLQPDYLDAQLALAALAIRKGSQEEALAIARQIQTQRVKSPVGYMLEGDLQMGQKKPALAVKPYEQAFALSKSGLLMAKIHASLSQAGKGKEAGERISQWLKEHPADAPTRLYLASTYLAERQTKLAIEQYQSILKQDPEYAPALNNLALLYQQEKDPRALQYAEHAYKVNPNSPEVLDTLGWMLVEQGNAARGLPLLQKAFSLAPEVAELHYHFVLGLVKSGDKAKARKELEHLLASGKNFPKIEEAKALLKQL